MRIQPLYMAIISSVALLLLGAACGKQQAAITTDSSNATTTVNVNTSANVPVIDTTNQNTNVAEDIVPRSATVTMTRDGFSPAAVTVRAGGTVTWVNNDATQHQPASDPHPTHTLLPGFDAQTGLRNGENYQFTFTRVGTFTYHDHLQSSVRGTVVVK